MCGCGCVGVWVCGCVSFNRQPSKQRGVRSDTSLHAKISQIRIDDYQQCLKILWVQTHACTCWHAICCTLKAHQVVEEYAYNVQSHITLVLCNDAIILGNAHGHACGSYAAFFPRPDDPQISKYMPHTHKAGLLAGVQALRLDLNDEASIQACVESFAPDVIVNCAAMSSPAVRAHAATFHTLTWYAHVLICACVCVYTLSSVGVPMLTTTSTWIKRQETWCARRLMSRGGAVLCLRWCQSCLTARLPSDHFCCIRRMLAHLARWQAQRIFWAAVNVQDADVLYMMFFGCIWLHTCMKFMYMT